MPEVVKFETVIPDGWERCEWGDQTAFAWGPPENGPYYFTLNGGVLYIAGQGSIDAKKALSVGIIPIRKKVVKPLEVTIEVAFDSFHYIQTRFIGEDGVKIGARSLNGKKFREVME